MVKSKKSDVFVLETIYFHSVLTGKVLKLYFPICAHFFKRSHKYELP